MINRNNILSIIIIALIFIFEIFVAAQIWQLNVVPLKYLALVIVIVIIFDFLLARLILGKKIWQRVLGNVFAVFMVAVLAFANQGLSKIQETMNAVTQMTTVSAVVELYVLREDRAETLEDVSDYTIAVTENVDQENTKVTLEAMENSLGKSVANIQFENIFAMTYNGLIN